MTTLQIPLSELAFKKLIGSVMTSLQTLNALHAILSSGTISSLLHLGLTKLINSAICDLYFLETDFSDLIKSGWF